MVAFVSVEEQLPTIEHGAERMRARSATLQVPRTVATVPERGGKGTQTGW